MAQNNWNKDEITKRVGDTVEKAGQKIKDTGSKLGEKVYEAGDKLEHSQDRKNLNNLNK